MKITFLKFLVAFFILLGHIDLFGQKPSYDSLKNLIKEDRNGKGNSTFKLSLSNLENIIKSRTTLKGLEGHLAEWTSYNSNNDIKFSWDDKTQDHTIPIFKIQYETNMLRKYFVIRTEVTNDLRNRIEYLEVIGELNGMQLAEFKKSLSSNGYLINENLTSIFRKQTWQHKAKDLMVTIKANPNGTCSIGIR